MITIRSSLLPRRGGVDNSNLVQVPFVPSCSLRKCLNFGLCSALLDNETDVFAISETWIKKNKDCSISKLRSSLSSYNFHNCPRLKKEGRGIAVVSV